MRVVFLPFFDLAAGVNADTAVMLGERQFLRVTPARSAL